MLLHSYMDDLGQLAYRLAELRRSLEIIESTELRGAFLALADHARATAGRSPEAPQ